MPGRAKQVVISNFEAEAVARTFRKEGDCAQLCLIVPRIWAYQTLASSVPVPLAVEVFAGCLYDTQRNSLAQIRSFLGLSLPTSRSEAWNALFDQHLVASDGFVRPENREQVSEEDENLLCFPSPFQPSPVKQLRRLLEARHLGTRLEGSKIAKFLCVFDVGAGDS